MMRIEAKIYTRKTRMQRCDKKPSFYTWREAKELEVWIPVIIVYVSWPFDIKVYFTDDFDPSIPF